MRLYTPRNVLSIALHYAGAAAVVGASIAFAAPWALIAGVGLAGGLMLTVTKGARAFYENRLQPHERIQDFSPHLGDIADELYKNSGLSYDKNPIYDFRAKPETNEGKSVWGKVMGATLEKIQKTPNAAALNFGKPIIMISTPLLKLLEDDEEKAVLAHEFAHAACQHSRITMPMKIMTVVSTFANTLTLIPAAFAAGIKPFLVGVIGSIAASSIVKSLTGYKHVKQTEEDSNLLTMPELHKKKQIETLSSIFSTAAVVGVAAALNPTYVPLWAGAKAIGIAGKLVNSNFSRSDEYQADRGAVVLGASPLALITSLRKMTALMERSKAEAWGDAPMPKPGALTMAWKQANASHPTTERRIARLADIARHNGFAEPAIDKAVNGPIDVSHAESVPPEVIRMIMKQTFV